MVIRAYHLIFWYIYTKILSSELKVSDYQKNLSMGISEVSLIYIYELPSIDYVISILGYN